MGVGLIKLIDRFAGVPICLGLSLLRNKNKEIPKDPKKILFIQLWGIGETILTLPAIKAVKNKFPHSEISILATKRSKDVFTGIDFIDKVIVIETNPKDIIKFSRNNRKKFDIVIDFEEYLNISSLIAFSVGKFCIGYSGNNRSRLYNLKTPYNDMQHVVKTHIDLAVLLGAKENIEKLIKMQVSKEDISKIDILLKENKIKSSDFLVGIAPGAAESAKSRMWPYERYGSLADMLISKYNAKIVFIGAPNEKEFIKNIQKNMKSSSNSFNLAGKTTVKQSFRLIEKCKLIIGNDSGPMHMGAAMGTPTIGLFGPNLPIRWKPFGKQNDFVYKQISCSPCINVHLGMVPECKYGKDNKCMKLITPEDVMKTATKLVKKVYSK